jgi:hypothetical protein
VAGDEFDMVLDVSLAHTRWMLVSQA